EAAPKIVENAKSPEASRKYIEHVAQFFGISPADVEDENAKRIAGLSKLTPQAFIEKIRGKGKKWYEGARRGFLTKRLAQVA
ncbi:MAG: hypothetical protein DRJ64_08455, partial [Thermoprotei archaeon]